MSGTVEQARPAAWERLLRAFAPVRAGEGRRALLMLANVFLLLCAYYFIKPAREGWLSVSELLGLTKLELKAFSGLSQAVLLALIVPWHARWTDRVRGASLIVRVNLVLAACLVVFWLLQPGLLIGSSSWMGLVFYLWAGMFAVFVVAQFWAFAADLYTEEDGRRLFPFIAIGATGGAVAGSWIAGRLTGGFGLDAFTLLLLAAGLLVATVVLTVLCSRGAESAAPAATPAPEEAEPAGPGAYGLIFRSRYLLAVAGVVVLFNQVNTTGENVLFGAVQSALAEEAAERGLEAGPELDQFLRNGTTAFYGDLYFWVNLTGFLLQAFVASRLLQFGGVKAILLALPVVSAIGYAAMLALPVLGVIRLMKIAENSTNYSLNNTARHVLWLPVTRAEKYKAKPAVDTIFARLGDALAALVVLGGTRLLGLGTSHFFAINLGLVAIWVLVALVVVRERRRLLAQAA